MLYLLNISKFTCPVLETGMKFYTLGDKNFTRPLVITSEI